MATLRGKDDYKEMLRLRRVYDTSDGREELERLIVEGAVFSTLSPDDPDFTRLLERRNYALELLYHLGVLVDENMSEIVDRLLNIPYTKGDKE